MSDNGNRVDLPSNKNNIYYMWIEKLESNNKPKGEVFCMRSASMLIRAVLYYSDNRVTIDVDDKGGYKI